MKHFFLAQALHICLCFTFVKKHSQKLKIFINYCYENQQIFHAVRAVCMHEYDYFNTHLTMILSSPVGLLGIQ